MRCDKCGYVSFDYSPTCPSCNRDLSLNRSKLGIFWDPPEANFDQFFTDAHSGLFRTNVAPLPKQEAELELDHDEEAPELDLDTTDDDFEFTLD